MATTTNLSATEELLASVTDPFTKVVCLLDANKVITDDMMHNVRRKLGNYHWVDMNHFCQGHHTKPKGIYAMFGEYFGKKSSRCPS